MARKAETDEIVQTEEIESVREEEKYDPWKDMRSVFIPRAMGGEQKYVMVGVNGRRYQVPRGKTVKVPYPLYERIQIMLEGEMQALEFAEKLRRDAEEQATLKRIV